LPLVRRDIVIPSFLGHRVAQGFTQSYTVKIILCELCVQIFTTTTSKVNHNPPTRKTQLSTVDNEIINY